MLHHCPWSPKIGSSGGRKPSYCSAVATTKIWLSETVRAVPHGSGFCSVPVHSGSTVYNRVHGVPVRTVPSGVASAPYKKAGPDLVTLQTIYVNGRSEAADPSTKEQA